MAVLVVAFVVFMERAQRRIVVQYPKRQQGNRQIGGEQSHISRTLNTAGVIPPIFASSLLLLPATITGFSGQGGPEWLNVVNALMGRRPAVVPANLYRDDRLLHILSTRRSSSIRRTPRTICANMAASYLESARVSRQPTISTMCLRELPSSAALYLCAVCALPEVLITQYAIPFYFGGTSLLIVVSVTMDTVGADPGPYAGASV